MESKIKSYDGSGEVKVFLEKISLHSALKGFEGEKAALYLASKLEGRAFDIYRRLSPEEKKNEGKIRAELLKEFERGHQDREQAIYALESRNRKEDESAHTYAYHILELVKLAYPTFQEDAVKTIAKDYYIRGLHPKMQVALKSLPGFDKTSINELATETTRLQIAGIQSIGINKTSSCMSVESPAIIDSIADKVMEKLKECSFSSQEDGGSTEATGATLSVEKLYKQRGQRGFFSRRQKPNYPQRTKSCRSCKSKDHLFRSCPTRFCQACGGRGHDAWNPSCPTYQ